MRRSAVLSASLACAVASVVGLVWLATGCDLPILHAEKPTACGYYPEWCDEAHTKCCPEGSMCFITADGQHVCEAAAGRDAGVSE